MTAGALHAGGVPALPGVPRTAWSWWRVPIFCTKTAITAPLASAMPAL